MNNPPPDRDPDLPYNHRTTKSILDHTTRTTLSLLPVTIILTTLLFSFRTATFFLISSLDSDPSFRSLFPSFPPTLSPAPRNPLPPHSTLHDPDPGPNFLDRSLFGPPSPSPSPNSTFLSLSPLPPSLAFLRPAFIDISPNSTLGIHDHHDAVTQSNFPGLGIEELGENATLSSSSPNFTHGIHDHHHDAATDDRDFDVIQSNFLGLGLRIGELSFTFTDNSTHIHDTHDGVTDDQADFLGLGLGREELVSLFVLFTVISAAYGWVMFAFVITYSSALGVVFVAVVNDLLRTPYNSFTRSVWNGPDLGLRRLSWFVIMRWAVRDAVTQVLGLWFFVEVRDHFSFFKLFLRLKLLPFSVALPWVSGYDKEISSFLFAWFMIDTVVSFVLGVTSWVTLVSTRRGGREIVKEGCYLMTTMTHQAIQLKCLELIFCGEFLRWVLARVFGRSLSILIQSFFDVYFMVAWLIFYFAARCKDASLNGRQFGRSELESLMEGLR